MDRAIATSSAPDLRAMSVADIHPFRPAGCAGLGPRQQYPRDYEKCRAITEGLLSPEIRCTEFDTGRTLSAIGDYVQGCCRSASGRLLMHSAAPSLRMSSLKAPRIVKKRRAGARIDRNCAQFVARIFLGTQGFGIDNSHAFAGI